MILKCFLCNRLDYKSHNTARCLFILEVQKFFRSPSILSSLPFLLVPHMTITLLQYYFTTLNILYSLSNPTSLLPYLRPSPSSSLPPHTTRNNLSSPLLLHGNQGQPVTKILLMPLTGRRHQLRVHCLCIGHPIGIIEFRLLV